MAGTGNDTTRWKRRIPLIVVAALLAAGILISLFRDMGVVATWRLRNTEMQLKAEVEKLRQENARLKREMDDLRSNPSTIEEEARKQGMIKKEEIVIVVPQRQDVTPQPPAKPGPPRR